MTQIGSSMGMLAGITYAESSDAIVYKGRPYKTRTSGIYTDKPSILQKNNTEIYTSSVSVYTKRSKPYTDRT